MMNNKYHDEHLSAETEPEAETGPEIEIVLESGIPLKPRKDLSRIQVAIKKLYSDGKVGECVFIPGEWATTSINTVCTNIGGSGWYAIRQKEQYGPNGEKGVRVWMTEIPIPRQQQL